MKKKRIAVIAIAVATYWLWPRHEPPKPRMREPVVRDILADQAMTMWTASGHCPTSDHASWRMDRPVVVVCGESDGVRHVVLIDSGEDHDVGTVDDKVTLQ